MFEARGLGFSLTSQAVTLGRSVSRAHSRRANRLPERSTVGSVIKKRRKRMAKKKHRKLLKKTRIQRRRQGK
jgi:hypothetical protein